MRGPDLAMWRKQQGYNQNDLMVELGVKSRATLSSWENSSKEVPRLVQLALKALELDPNLRLRLGKRVTAIEKREYFSEKKS